MMNSSSRPRTGSLLTSSSRPKTGGQLTSSSRPKTGGQLTSGLRSGTERPDRKGVLAEVQIQPRAGQPAKHHPSPAPVIPTVVIQDFDNDLESTDSGGSSDIVKAPVLNVPAFPGALSRETTSYGVFSNLAAHSHPKPRKTNTEKGALNSAKRGPQTQLLKAVKNGDVKQVTKLLTGTADLTLDFTDDEGEPLLHLGISTGSDELMKLLLSRKPPINATNQIGQTALHVAAYQGREHIAYMLLQSGADVNSQNTMTGCTALHEAVSGGHLGMVDLFLCCGAETTVQTKDGLTPLDMCNEKCSRAEFEASVNLLNSGNMEMKEVGVSVSRFKSVGIVTEPRQMKETTCAVCRRLGTCNKNVSRRLDDQEEVIGDEISIRLGKSDTEYPMLITMSMSTNVNRLGEEMVMKTAQGREIKPSDVWQENELNQCKFSAAINHTASFVAVCRPRKEQLPVNRGVSTVCSEVDPRIKIHIGKNSFNKNSSMSIQVIELHEDISLEEGAILSSTPFFMIESDEPLSRPIDVELPEPMLYGGEQGVTVVLTKDSPTSSWSVRNKIVRSDNKQASVTFQVSSLPMFAVVTKTVPKYDAKSVTQEIQHTFEQVRTQFYTVCFLCVTKNLDRGFRVAVECCEAKLADSRRRFWATQGFEERQEKSTIDEFKLPSKQAFTVKFYENIVFRQGCQTSSLVFHPKLTNVIQFDVGAKTDDTINGRVYIYQDNKTNGNNVRETDDDDLLTSVDISLVLRKQRQGSESQHDESNHRQEADRVKNKTNSVLSLDSKASSSTKSDSILSSESSVSIKGSAKGITGSLNSTNNSLSSSVKSNGSGKSNSGNASGSVQSFKSNNTNVSVNGNTRFNSSKSARSSRQNSNESNSLTNESSGSSDNKGSVVFLTNKLLDRLLDEMEDDWYKIFVLMGIPFQELEVELMKTSNHAAVKKKIFIEWRDAQADRDDTGLPLLLSALFKGGCRDVANTIQINLKRWHEKIDDKNMRLYQWLCRAYQDSNLFVPPDYPKPMSDSYLVLMADELTPTNVLGQALTLAAYEIDEITSCKNYVYPGIKVMKMLTLFREAVPSTIDALKKLIECLEKLNYEKLRNYSVMCAKAWVKRTATRKDDPLRTQVDTLMKQL